MKLRERVGRGWVVGKEKAAEIFGLRSEALEGELRPHIKRRERRNCHQGSCNSRGPGRSEAVLTAGDGGGVAKILK
jgi:hypothetical protein